MKVCAFHSAAAVTFGIAMTSMVIAQTPQAPQNPQQKPQRPTTEQTQPQRTQGMENIRSMDGKTVTVTGCLMQEQNVAGQTPNPAERVGAAPDYILTNVQMRAAGPETGTPGTPDAPEPPKAPTAPGATMGAAGAAGAGNLKVKLSSVDNDQMRTNLNKQVEVTGRLEIDAAGHTTGAKPAQPPSTPERVRDNVLGDMHALPEVHVTNVRATGQACTPSKQ